MQVRLVWLVDASIAEETGTPVPDDLAEAIAKLSRKMGVGELRTAAQMFVNANASEVGTFRSTGTALVGGPCELEFEGVLTKQGRRLEVGVDAKKGEKALCHIRTTINARPGHPVILGMTPVDSMPSVFVVELLAADSE
jgi:hypothetical protein